MSSDRAVSYRGLLILFRVKEKAWAIHRQRLGYHTSPTETPTEPLEASTLSGMHRASGALRHCPLRSLGVRHCSTAPAVAPLVARLNATLEKYPAHSFAAHLTTSLGTFGVAFVVLR